MPDQVPQARAFADACRSSLDWSHTGSAGNQLNEVAALVAGFLDPVGAAQPVVSRDLPAFEHVNLQRALDAWAARSGRTVTGHGILPPQHSLGLARIVSAAPGPDRLRLTAPALTARPDGPGTTLGCLKLAVLLVSDARGRYVLLVQAANEHHPGLEIEVAGLPADAAQAVLGELDQLRRELNVYRGQLLDVTLSPQSGVVLTFAAPPGLRRGDVVLPDAVLARAERHALGVAAHRDALLAAGQHLKRGLLLYGPPGAGKTHTARYLLGQLPGYTRLVLTGRALLGVGAVTELARELQPSVVVLEDVDLLAEGRSTGPGANPVLFDLLDAMDGAAPDADLLFLLTTSRADRLGPALAARPGRVDVAVEIKLPDAPARERLLARYGRGVPLALTPADIAATVERTHGMTASFLRELIRRSVLEALHDLPAEAGVRPPPAGPGAPTVTGVHLARALDELLDSAQGVARTLLGVGAGPVTRPPGGALASGGFASAGQAAVLAHRRAMLRRGTFRG